MVVQRFTINNKSNDKAEIKLLYLYANAGQTEWEPPDLESCSLVQKVRAVLKANLLTWAQM